MRVLVLATLAACLGGVYGMTPANTAAQDDWSSEQLEVIESIRSCWESDNKRAWLANCYHEDFLGWYKDDPNLITIAAKRSVTDWIGETCVMVEFTPHKIHVSGDLAIAVYSAQLKCTNDETDETTIYDKERWMEASIRTNDRWLSIAEHASLMPEN